MAGSAKYFHMPGDQRPSVGNARSKRAKLDRECEAAVALEEKVQLKRDAKDVASKLAGSPALMRKMKQVMKASEAKTHDPAVEFNPDLTGRSIARPSHSHRSVAAKEEDP